MTDLQRLAEKIWEYLKYYPKPLPYKESIKHIEFLLSEAMEEVRKEQHDFEMKLTRTFVLAAYTRAAEVAREEECGRFDCDHNSCNVAKQIAAAIEALKNDL